MSTAQLQQRRTQLEEHIANLGVSPEVEDAVRKARDATATHRAQVEAAEAELASIDGEIGVLTRDRRAEAERQHLADLKAKRERLVRVVEERLVEQAKAQQGARQFGQASCRILELNAEAWRLAQALGIGRNIPPALKTENVAETLGGRFGAEMAATLPLNQRGGLGGLKWFAAGRYQATDDWAEADQSALAKGLQPIFEESKNNG